MNQKSSIMILGSGLMVLTLATLVGLFLFSPASKSARAGSSTEPSSYPDIATLTQESTEQPAQDSTATTTPPTSSSSSSALVPSRNYRFGQGATTMTPTTPTDSGVSISRASGQQASGQQGQAVQTNQNPLLPSQQSPGSQAWSQTAATSQTAKDIKTNDQVATAPAQKTTTAVAKKPATTQTAPKKTTSTTQKNTSAAAKPAPKQLASTTYWIQLASYSSLSRAKGTQEDLKKLGLSTNIEVSDIGNGRLVYRLKAGAWTSEKEALNFLDQFKTSHPRFADAFVVNNRGKR